MATRIKPVKKELYGEDFYAWTKAQAVLLRALKKLPKYLTLRLPDGSEISPATAFDLYLNGELFHSAKREQWSRLNHSRLEPVLYSALLRGGHQGKGSHRVLSASKSPRAFEAGTG